MSDFFSPRRPNALKQLLVRLAWSGGWFEGGLEGVWALHQDERKFCRFDFSDFLSKTAEIGKILLAFVGMALRRVGTTLAHTTGKSSLRYAFWRVPHTQRSSEEPTPVTPQMRRLCGFGAIQVRGPDPWGN